MQNSTDKIEYSDLLRLADESDEACSLMVLLSNCVSDYIKSSINYLNTNDGFVGIYSESIKEIIEAYKQLENEPLDKIPATLDGLVNILIQELKNNRNNFYSKYYDTINQVIQKSSDSIENNIFVGLEAYKIKLNVLEYKEYAKRCYHDFYNEIYLDPSIIVSDFTGISDSFSRLFIILDEFDSKLTSVRIKQAADIPFIIEGNGHTAVGIYSKLFGGTSLYFGHESGGVTTSKNICIKFALGIMPRNRFRIEIADESFFGDWVKWLCGGFIFGDRPNHSFTMPDFGDKLTTFISTHVISQWSGNTSLQSIETALNSRANTDKNSVEEYAKYISA